MKSEIQFFMTEYDESELENYFFKYFDKIEHDQIFDKLWLGGDFIQLLHSRRYGDVLTAGRISIITEPEKNPPIEKIYNSMRRWLKKRYQNNMSSENEKIPNSKMKIKDFWYSQNILKWLTGNEKRNLKQFRDGVVVFIPEE